MKTKKCKECKHFERIGNTDTTGMGLCTACDSFFPMGEAEECYFTRSKPLTCKDCSRFGEDDACFTAGADDPIFREDFGMCPGFLDKREETIVGAIFDWLVQGGAENAQEKLKALYAEADEMAKKIL